MKFHKVLPSALLNVVTASTSLSVAQTTATAFVGIPRSRTTSRMMSSATYASGSSDSSNADSKFVLVTGGNKGIGRAICERLLEHHKDVKVLLGSRDLGRGNEAKKEIEGSLGEDACSDRLHVISLDTGSDESVKDAAGDVQKITSSLYGIVNNAGIMSRGDMATSNNVNYFGPRRVCDAFKGILQRPGGRVVNIASASGPIFVSNCADSALAEKLSKPWTISRGIAELDEIARDPKVTGDAYGFSKALVSAYTWWFAKEEPDLVVNAVTPGFINTDMTAGAGASNPPSKGAIPPVWLLMSPQLSEVPTGRYYGSDCKRSPLDTYRGPGDPVYEGPDGK